MTNRTATSEFQRLSLFFANLSEETLVALKDEQTRIGYRLVSFIQTEKLQGQVLHKRGGKGSSNLSSHITSDTTRDGETITTRLGVMSGVPYARIHEYGGQINIPEVKGKLMAFDNPEMSTQLLFDAPGHTGGAMIFTRKHKAFTVNMPERSYLRSTLREKHDEIVESMKAVINKETSNAQQ